MSNPAKRKGSSFELLIRNYISELVPCERIPAGAELDRGDLWTPSAAIQCKNRAQLSLGAWLDDTVAQQANARKPYHWLVVKRRGSADPANQFAICTVEQLRRILDEIDN
jgi:hypothetical protein